MSATASYLVGVRLDGNASGLKKAADEALRAQKTLAGGSVREYQRMADARKTLGVRSEREVQREMQRTEAAYNRLARSGTASLNEQRLAARAMREEITRLTNEMGRMTTRQKLAMGARGVAAIGAGVGVATAMIAPRVNKALDYDQRVAYLANTAYNDRGTAGRRSGMGDLNAMIVDAVRTGGGTRDSAVNTAESLFGAGIFKPEEVRTILRQAIRAGTANNAEPTAFAQMAISANQTMGIRPDQMARMFGMGTFAGQEGGFEIKDMARWLPQQMAAAKAVGMSGEAGFAKLAALNQAAVVTAGTKDEAGNNVVNLLAKLGSQDTVKDFKKQGINLPKQLAEGRMKGLDALDVVGNLLQQQLGKDKNYQSVQKQLQAAKSDSDRRAALESVGNIAQGTVIGKVFQDRQALMGLYGFMNGRDRVNKIAQGALGNTDASDRNFDLISNLPSYAVNQRRQESEMAMQSSIDKLTPAIGTLNNGVTALMREYPGYTTAVVAAGTALTALAGSAMTLALLNGGKLPGGMRFPGGGGGAGGAAAGAGRSGGLLGGMGRAGGWLTAASAIASLVYTSPEEIEILKSGERMREGSRGRGFDDPRLLTRSDGGARSLADRLGTGTGALPLQLQDLKGEITVRVTGAPGLNVEATAVSNSPRIPFRTNLGPSMTGSGF